MNLHELYPAQQPSGYSHDWEYPEGATARVCRVCGDVQTMPATSTESLF